MTFTDKWDRQSDAKQMANLKLISGYHPVLRYLQNAGIYQQFLVEVMNPLL